MSGKFSAARNTGRAGRGAGLIVNVGLMAIVAASTLWLAGSLLDYGRLEGRRRDFTRALHIAESGVQEVIHWVNRPADYASAPTLFAQDAGGDFSNLKTAIAGGAVYNVVTGSLPSFTNGEEEFTGNVTSIQIMASTDPKAVCRVRSVGQSHSGISRAVEADLIPLDPDLGRLPAALTSNANTSFGGNSSVHWGEVWSRNALTVPEQNKVKDVLADKAPNGEGLVNYRSVMNLDFKSNSGWKEGSDWAWYDDHPTANQPCLNMTRVSDQKEYGPRMYQYAPLDFPVFDYEAFKAFAIRHGNYYSTDVDGNIYKDGIEDGAHLVNWSSEFDVSADYGGPWKIVFIDTIDGQPPNGSPTQATTNLADIGISGSAPHTRGVFYINANIRVTGTGNPPSLTVPDPTKTSGNTTLQKIMHQGLMVVNGKMINAGNMVVFGSVYVEGQYEGSPLQKVGYDAGGTPTVWFDQRLKAGFPLPLISRVYARRWWVG